MNILDTIIAKKKEEVALTQRHLTIDDLARTNYYQRNCISISHALNLQGASGIIAEHKRRSPSKGIINTSENALNIVQSYQQAGASALSILTDETFFGGTNYDITSVRDHIEIPILRKEFIIDEFQIHEAKSIGADLILLIAACLTKEDVRRFATLANQLGMEVLLELHDEDEFDHVCDEVQLVGINNRSLKTFEVNIDRSLKLASRIPSNKIKVAESGISHPSDVNLFRENNYKGFLIGENFMKSENPGESLRTFINELK